MIMQLAVARFWVLALFASWLSAQETPVFNEDIRPLYFEMLSYPLAARFTHVQGVVVVRVRIDKEGKVISSSAISGPKILLQDCLANAKKWKFGPTADRTAVLVYSFRIQGLCSSCSSQFLFEPPNLATITIGVQVVDHSG